MTHLHTDHAGGLHRFPDTEILAARAEITYASGLRGQLRGYPNPRWPGQLGVLVEDDDHTVFLAADSSYTQDLMLHGTADGVGPDEDAERLTHQRIRTYAKASPTVYLVAHDPDTGIRLAERRVIPPISAERAA